MPVWSVLEGSSTAERKESIILPFFHAEGPNETPTITDHAQWSPPTASQKLPGPEPIRGTRITPTNLRQGDLLLPDHELGSSVDSTIKNSRSQEPPRIVLAFCKIFVGEGNPISYETSIPMLYHSSPRPMCYSSSCAYEVRHPLNIPATWKFPFGVSR